MELAVVIWDRCGKEFLPYLEYAPYSGNVLTYDAIHDIYGCAFPDDFRFCVVRHMEKHPDFCRKVKRPEKMHL